MSLHVVFVEPEIPPNTGNIARTCAATDSVLHLVKPLGFSIDVTSLKRAGLDYWPYVRLEVHSSRAVLTGLSHTGCSWQPLRVAIATRISNMPTKTCSSLAARPPAFPGTS